MFICTKAPLADHFPPDLKKLGFKYENGRFLEINPPHNYFDRYASDNELYNDTRKEAMHECIRQQVVKELGKFGIKELFLHGQEGTDVSQDKPDGPHVRLLATELGELRRKKDIVVVVGESAGSLQDAGIWAYRVVSREGGVENGTAVGLAARIEAYGQGIGMVILNPGQLLFSHAEKKAMTMTTWLGRQRKTATGEAYEVSEEYNRVPGHQSQDRHIVTCFEHVLPHILRQDARVYLAVIGDSAKGTIDYLDQLFLNKSETGLASQLEAVAIIEGNDPEDIISDKLKNFLASDAKKWIQCPDLPHGRLVRTPGTGQLLTISETDAEDVDAEDEAYEECAKLEVLCPTFSAGKCGDGSKECVFPTVIPDVLDLFWEKREKAEECELKKKTVSPSTTTTAQSEQAPAA